MSQVMKTTSSSSTFSPTEQHVIVDDTLMPLADNDIMFCFFLVISRPVENLKRVDGSLLLAVLN